MLLSKFNRSFIYFVFFSSLLFLFTFLENLNFIFDRPSLILNILPNTTVADSYKYFWNSQENSLFFFDVLKNYLSQFSENIEHYQTARIYPSNSLQHTLYFSIFKNNIYFFGLFNFFLYIFIVHRISLFIHQDKLFYFYALNILNFLIIGSLSLPNKEITAFFSFCFFLIYYFEKKIIYFILSLIFAIFTRFEFIILLIYSFIIISPIIQKINHLIEKKLDSFYIVIVLYYFLTFIFFFIFANMYSSDFLNLINGGEHYGRHYKNIFLQPFNVILFLIYTIFLKYVLLYIFKIDLKKNYYLLILLSLKIILLNSILPFYPWFYEQLVDIEAFQTEKSLGVTLFLYNTVMDGYYFVVFPFKIALSLFSGVFQKISFTSYETVFTYISHLLFLVVIIYCLVKFKFKNDINLFFIVIFFLIVFSLPPISVHRYIFFLYEYFIIICCINPSNLHLQKK